MLMHSNTVRRSRTKSRSQGFSLIELMLAMVIGILIIGGVFSLYITTRDTQRSSEDQLQLLADARFAIETIAYDLRHAGIWGGTNVTTLLDCYLGDPECAAADLPAAIAGDCSTRWYIDLLQPIIAVDNAIAPVVCNTTPHKPGTDVLGLHYADSNSITTALLDPNTTYVRSNFRTGQVFVGSTIPAIAYKPDDDKVSKNFRLVSRAYYVSTYTDTAADKLPSLHRVDLQAGPLMVDEMLLQGVDNFQIQFGVDTTGDTTVDSYVTATSVTDWTKIYSAKIWILVRSEHKDRGGVGGNQTFTIADQTLPTFTDGYRRYLVSSVVRLRNMTRLDESSVGGS